MTILTEASLEFARVHISKYYDSDFYPKPIEFDAMWHQWDDVKKELLSKNVAKLSVLPPRAMTIAKPRSGFRVVHQLEPLEAIAYTALGSQIAGAVEAARMPVGDQIACSYRFEIADGSFFAGGSGWESFTQRTEECASKFSHILVTDITDFYNQIYLHRLNNAIEASDQALKAVGDDIEMFLSSLNSKASQGVPVGPAASIVMAEAVLIDVDKFIRDQGVVHTRYVDDFRIFSDSPAELQRVLERLTLYLYENHRLTLSSEKTRVMLAKAFVSDYIHSVYAEEKLQVLETLKIFNPYTDEYEEMEFFEVDEEQEKETQLESAIAKVLSYETLDLGLARSVIRSGKRSGLTILVTPIVGKFHFFAPVMNDVALYLQEVTDEELAESLVPAMEELVAAPQFSSQLARYWLEWYLSQHARYLSSKAIHNYIFSGPNVENQARAAITTKNLAWVRDHKAQIYNLGGWARRSILNASRVLPSDERQHWLKLFIANSPMILDRWVAKWVMDTA